MFAWALLFFLVALVAAFFGFFSLAAGAASIAKIVFFIALALGIVSMIARGEP